MKKKIIVGFVVIILIVLIISAIMKKECNVIADGSTREEMLLTVSPGYCKGNYELILTSREPTNLLLDELNYIDVNSDSNENKVIAHAKETLSSTKYHLTSEPTVVKVVLKKELHYNMMFPEKKQDDNTSLLVNYKITKVSK